MVCEQHYPGLLLEVLRNPETWQSFVNPAPAHQKYAYVNARNRLVGRSGRPLVLTGAGNNFSKQAFPTFEQGFQCVLLSEADQYLRLYIGDFRSRKFILIKRYSGLLQIF